MQQDWSAFNLADLLPAQEHPHPALFQEPGWLVVDHDDLDRSIDNIFEVSPQSRKRTAAAS